MCFYKERGSLIQILRLCRLGGGKKKKKNKGTTLSLDQFLEQPRAVQKSTTSWADATEDIPLDGEIFCAWSISRRFYDYFVLMVLVFLHCDYMYSAIFMFISLSFFRFFRI